MARTQKTGRAVQDEKSRQGPGLVRVLPLTAIANPLKDFKKRYDIEILRFLKIILDASYRMQWSGMSSCREIPT